MRPGSPNVVTNDRLLSFAVDGRRTGLWVPSAAELWGFRQAVAALAVAALVALASATC